MATVGGATFALDHFAAGVGIAVDDRRNAFLVVLGTYGRLATPTAVVGGAVVVRFAGAFECDRAIGLFGSDFVTDFARWAEALAMRRATGGIDHWMAAVVRSAIAVDHQTEAIRIAVHDRWNALLVRIGAFVRHATDTGILVDRHRLHASMQDDFEPE